MMQNNNFGSGSQNQQQSNIGSSHYQNHSNQNTINN